MEDTLSLRQAIAIADLFDLLSTVFSFPSEEVAAGICDGSFKDDALSCLRELGSSDEQIETFLAVFLDLEAAGEELSIENMRKEYSYLYLVLGEYTRIFPFEGAFLHVAEARKGLPSLFLTPRTQQVKEWMKRCDALPENASNEPVDSIYNEFEFMRLLCTSLANALQLQDSEAAAIWQSEIAGFYREHIEKWVPAFMEHTILTSRSPVYAALARFALLTLTLIHPTTILPAKED